MKGTRTENYGSALREEKKEMIEKVMKGAIGGLFGGLVFGLWMAEQGTLPTIAKLVGSSSAGVGFLVHMATAPSSAEALVSSSPDGQT